MERKDFILVLVVGLAAILVLSYLNTDRTTGSPIYEGKRGLQKCIEDQGGITVYEATRADYYGNYCVDGGTAYIRFSCDGNEKYFSKVRCRTGDTCVNSRLLCVPDETATIY